jgi:tetratricopeptide (TPR) repeat protein
MNDELPDERSGFSRSDAAPNPAALDAALAAAATDGEDARAFLREQKRLTALQAKILHEEHALELSHLKWRRFNDRTKGALEMAVGLVVLLLLCGLGATIWNATEDHDLVIDAFSVPPDMVAQGLTGSVLASRVRDHFVELQSETVSTVERSSSLRTEKADVVRVEIPETGISFDEANRYLRGWLGREIHVGGDLVRTGSNFALTLRYGDRPGVRAEGRAADLDAMTDRAAESLFAAASPYRYVEYLGKQERFPEAQAFVAKLAETGDARQRALADTEWAMLDLGQARSQAAAEAALVKIREAVRLDGGGPIYAWWANIANSLGHDEETWRAADATATMLHRDPNALHGDETVNCEWRIVWPASVDDITGDYRAAANEWRNLSRCATVAYLDVYAGDLAADHDIGAARRVAASIPRTPSNGVYKPAAEWAEFLVAEATANWREAISFGHVITDDVERGPRAAGAGYWDMIKPHQAYVMARQGDVAGATALIAQTAYDCDICLRARAAIAALKGDRRQATHLYAIVSSRSPHIPFADTDWGRMLLLAGDYNGAIAKFAVAHAKGPHFADPLEMWGEALMQRNRSDLALAKLEEANKYAPNWGRLHLEWGKALMYLGRRNDAQQQFAIASRLDLAPADATALARWRSKHV